MSIVNCELGYDIEFCGIDELRSFLQGAAFTVCDYKVHNIYNDRLGLNELEQKSILKSSERSKTMKTAQRLCEEFLAAGLKRSGTVAALGGGVVGDVAGFAASIYMRGVPYVQIPTTLLAMCDSSVGGKTAVNFGGVKNYLGSFYNPVLVLICTQLLHSLPARQFLSGIGEVVKAALIDDRVYEAVSANRHNLLAREEGALREVIAACIALKAGIVKQDFKDFGARRILNLGHTAGHALESLHGYKYTHGECVMSGILWEVELGITKLEPHILARAHELIGFFMPNRIDIGERKEFFRLMELDKKN